MTDRVDEILEALKSEALEWRINKIPSPLMREGEDECELLDDLLLVKYGFLIYSISIKYVRMISLNKY
jgi:hypothetical protein